MQIIGAIRQGQDGIDIALRNDKGMFESLERETPIHNTVSDAYMGVISKGDKVQIGANIYPINTSSVRGNIIKSVSFPSILGIITISKYSKTINNDNNPSDKARLVIDLPTVVSNTGDDNEGLEGDTV